METHDESKMTDKVKIVKTPIDPTTQPAKVKVRVLRPIFKNGKTYKKGMVLELHPQTAANFIREGDVEAYEA